MFIVTWVAALRIEWKILFFHSLISISFEKYIEKWEQKVNETRVMIVKWKKEKLELQFLCCYYFFINTLRGDSLSSVALNSGGNNDSELKIVSSQFFMTSTTWELFFILFLFLFSFSNFIFQFRNVEAFDDAIN